MQQLLAALSACHKNVFKGRDLFLEALPAAESRAGSRAKCQRFASPICGRLFVYVVALTPSSPRRSRTQ